MIAPPNPPKQIWVLFNNDYSGYAIDTLRRSRKMLGLPEPASREQLPRATQKTLFD